MLDFWYKHGSCSIFAHGKPEIIQKFRRAFKGWEIVGDISPKTFGRDNHSDPDLIIVKELRKMP